MIMSVGKTGGQNHGPTEPTDTTVNDVEADGRARRWRWRWRSQVEQTMPYVLPLRRRPDLYATPQTRSYINSRLSHESADIQWDFIIIICPIAVAYSMGQIIKSVCVCLSVNLSVCVSVRLRSLSLSHFLIDFHQNWHRRKNPQKEERVRWGSISNHPSPILPHKTPILGQKVLKTHANI